MQTEMNKGEKPNGRRNGLTNIDEGRIDAGVMRAFVETRKLPIETDVEPAQLAFALFEWFAKNTKKDDRVQCDVCQGVSSVDVDHCPFCGDEEGEEEAPEETAEAKSSDRSDDAPEAELAAEADENSASKDSSMSYESRQQLKSNALAKPSEAQLITAQDLDVAIENFVRLDDEFSRSTVDAAEKYWLRACALLDINARELWKLRVDDKGKPKYKSWDAFVKAELPMNVQQSYAALDLARNFDSPKTIRAIGTTKALAIIKAVPEQRAELIEKAKSGASLREVKEAVKENVAKHGPAKDTQHAKAGRKGNAATTKKVNEKKVPKERVSITAMEGSKTIPLYKKPASLKGVVIKECARAKRLADMPFGRHEMANGLVQYFFVGEKNGELFLKIETRRED